MGEHSIVGASSMSRWAFCTASPSLILTMPKEQQNTSNPAASEGSSAHRVCDLGVQKIVELREAGEDPRWVLQVDLLGTHIARYKDSDDFEVIGYNPFKPHEQLAQEYEMLIGWQDDHFHCDVEMQAGIRFYLSEILKILDECSDDVIIVPETRCYPLPGKDNVFGTSDCVIIDLQRQKIWVIDFKFGRGIVYALENYQALFYASGAIAEHSIHLQDDAEVTLMIVQPRVEFEDGRSISEAQYSVKEVVEWSQTVLDPAVIATTSPALAQYQMGEYCQYCPARTRCPLIAEYKKEGAKRAFSGDPGEINIDEFNEEHLNPIVADDPESFAKDLKTAHILDLWSKRLHEIADDKAKGGQKIPGFKPVRKTTRWRWKDEQAVLDRLKKNKTQDKGIGTKPLTVAQMKTSGALSKADIDELAVKPEGEIILARESDRRKSADPAIAAFSKVEK